MYISSLKHIVSSSFVSKNRIVSLELDVFRQTSISNLLKFTMHAQLLTIKNCDVMFFQKFEFCCFLVKTSDFCIIVQSQIKYKYDKNVLQTEF